MHRSSGQLFNPSAKYTTVRPTAYIIHDRLPSLFTPIGDKATPPARFGIAVKKKHMVLDHAIGETKC